MLWSSSTISAACLQTTRTVRSSAWCSSMPSPRRPSEPWWALGISMRWRPKLKKSFSLTHPPRRRRRLLLFRLHLPCQLCRAVPSALLVPSHLALSVPASVGVLPPAVQTPQPRIFVLCTLSMEERHTNVYLRISATGIASLDLGRETPKPGANRPRLFN